MEIAAQSPRSWEEPLARVGLVAKGVSFAIVGILALELALGSGGKATSREGALQQLAGTAFGMFLLIALALGFAAYVVWRLIQAWVEDKWAKRAGYAARGLIYAGLTFSTIKILVGAGQQESQSGKAHKTAAVVLAWPGGRWLVGIAGVCILGAALWNLYRGVSRKFEEKWTRGYSAWGSRAGVVGHIARFVVFGLIGWFVIKAAVQYDPKEAIGLDGALQKLAHASYGAWLLGLTAAGFVAYAVYCLVDARYRDVTP